MRHVDHDGALHGGGRQLIELLRALESRPVEATTCVLRAPSALGRQLQREGLPLRFFGTNRSTGASPSIRNRAAIHGRAASTAILATARTALPRDSQMNARSAAPLSWPGGGGERVVDGTRIPK